LNHSTKSLLVGTIGAASLFLAGNAGVSADTTHKVANHDTVWGLSQKYGVSIQSIEQLNHISSNSHLIYPGQNVQIPDKDAKATPVKATTPKQTANTSTYSVKAGDSLWTIAQAHKTSVAKLMSLNNLNSSVLQPGQTLKLVGTVAAQPAKTQAQPQQQAQAQTQEVTPQISANHTTYKVQSGDSLYTVAQKFGVSTDSIRKANALTSSTLQVGQSLTINDPTKDPSAVQSTPTAAPVKTSVQATAKTQPSTPAPQKAEPQSNSSNAVTSVAPSNQQHGQAANSAGNTYSWGQCTWFAKNRASWAGNYWGNGGNWDSSARSQGFAVDNTPAAGSLVVFHPGQSVGGQWTADGSAGHVAYVESVSGNTITISQGGMGFPDPSGPNYQTISNANQYTYIHP
jgi:LysM repeat protein